MTGETAEIGIGNVMDKGFGIRSVIVRLMQLLAAVIAISMMATAGIKAETRIGAGTGWLYGQPDILFSYRPEMNHFAFGFRIAYDESESSQYGAYESTDSSTYIGPVVSYFFTPESPGSFYALAGLYQWTLELETPELDESDSASSTALYIGGGYTYKFKGKVFVDVGLAFNTGDQLFVETSASSVETTGGEARLVLGIYTNK